MGGGFFSFVNVAFPMVSNFSELSFQFFSCKDWNVVECFEHRKRDIMKYSDIINDYDLWIEYVDTSGVDTEEDFNNMSFAEKLEMIKACFGLEANA